MKLPEREIIYIAGFLDGDGSITTQIVRDNTYRRKFYIRLSVNFYQKTKRYWFLLYLKRLLKAGTVNQRNDGMSQYTICSIEPVKELLILLKPHLKIKRSLARLVLQIIEKRQTVTTDADFIEVCELVDKTAKLTDSKKRSITSDTVRDFLNSRAQTKISQNSDRESR
jgi:hypothetical protein